MPTFGECLKTERKTRNLTQAELAKVLGVTERTIRNYETGEREPDLTQAVKLADFFNVSLDYLFGRTDSPTGYVFQRQVLQMEAPRMEQDLHGTYVYVAPSYEDSQDELEFLAWVADNLGGSFFKEFSSSSNESKQQIIDTLKFFWKQEKQRTGNILED